MNTPTHAVVSLLALGKEDKPKWIFPAVFGAFLPDIPMILFYAILTILGYPQQYIWDTAYFQQSWQDFFDVFNSLPLMLIGLGIAYYFKNFWFMVLFISMSLHVVGDLPLHHDDGHRHFYPFSNWRFVSPVSYWDWRYYGNIVMPIELAFFFGASIYMMWQRNSKPLRIVVGGLLGVTVLFFVFAILTWGGGSS